jgi:hypothetical protein
MNRTAIAVVFAAFSATAWAADASLAGSWKMVSNINDTTRESLCTFTQDGAAFHGECKREGRTTSFTGTVADKAVHMTAKSEYEGTPIDLTYEASFADDGSVKGSVDVQPFGAKGTFTLTKQPPPQ